MTVKDEANEVVELTRDVSALFAGRSAQVQGAALADLLALWLAGHVARDPEQQQKVREQILAMHIKRVWKLVDVNYRDIIEPKLKRTRQ